jgi:WD40 repeat protein/serine/threonine protein kinase
MAESSPRDAQHTVEVQAPSGGKEPPTPLSPSLHNLFKQAGTFSRSSFLAMLRADQRKRWQRGERLLVETYLQRLPNVAADEEAILDLIYSEVVVRDDLAQAPSLDEYVHRFPQYEASLRRQFALNDLLGSDSLFDSHADLPAFVAPEPAMTSVMQTPVRNPPSTVDPIESLHVPASKTVPDLGAAPAPVQEGKARAHEWPTVPGYVLLDVLGRGGMGVVYKARQLKLKRTVALKMILTGAHAGPQELDRLRSEADAVARLQHPNIVQIHEINEQDGLPYLALEFVDGTSLDKKLLGTPMAPNEAAALLQSLAEAMDYAHQQGVIHRDLKPANVLLARAERKSSPSITVGNSTPPPLAKITDFGLAKQLESGSRNTGTGAIVGTPSYMAPEQAAGKNHEIGPLTDVYALGAILYECLTGRPPFRAPTPMDTVLQVLSDEPVAPTRLQPQTPRDLETICLKCLQKEPPRRYASAAELAEDLRRYLHGEPISARPVGQIERAIKWARRRPVIAGLSAVLVTVLVVGFVLVSWLWLRAEHARKAESQARVQEKAEKEAKNAALKQSEQTLYFNRIALADREWWANNVPGVETLLDHYTADTRRGWEWHYLKRLCHAELLTVAGQFCVAISPNGRLLATANNGNVYLWNATTGRLGLTLSAAQRRVNHLAFSHDGRLLASAGDDKTIKLWDPATGKELGKLTGHDDPVVQLAFSLDGRWLASAGNNDTVKVWDVATRRVLHTVSGNTTVAFSPVGSLLATASGEKEIRLWDPATGNEVRTLDGPDGHTASVVGVTFSPEGKWLATASLDQTIRIWDVATGQERRTIYVRAGKIARIAFSPDGRYLACASGDEKVPGGVKMWDAESGQELRSYRWQTTGGSDVAFSPGGRRLFAADSMCVKVWDATSDLEARTLRGHTGEVESVAFSPDGKRLASGDTDGTVRVWDVASGKQLAACLGHLNAVTCVAFTPDGKGLASASIDKTVLFWNPATGEEVRTLRPGGAVLSLAFSHDGRSLATASSVEEHSGEVKIWDVGSGRELRLFSGEEIIYLVYSPDCKRLVGLSKFQAHIWDCSTSKEVLTLRQEPIPFARVAFSPDGQYLVTTGGVTDQGQAKIWDANRGTIVREIPSRGNRVGHPAYHPEGRRLAVAGWDHTVKLWDPLTGQDILTLHGHTDRVTSVAFSPNGWRIASASTDKTVRIWDATPLPGDAK